MWDLKMGGGIVVGDGAKWRGSMGGGLYHPSKDGKVRHYSA